MPFLPRLHAWTMVYRYVSEGAEPGCLQHVVANGILPNDEGRIYITPNFFRHAEEAKAFLNLDPKNKAQAGLCIDLGFECNFLDWKPVRPVPGPGGALEAILQDPIPPTQIFEYFETHEATGGPTNHASHGLTVWDFRFTTPP